MVKLGNVGEGKVMMVRVSMAVARLSWTDPLGVDFQSVVQKFE